MHLPEPPHRLYSTSALASRVRYGRSRRQLFCRIPQVAGTNIYSSVVVCKSGDGYDGGQWGTPTAPVLFPSPRFHTATAAAVVATGLQRLQHLPAGAGRVHRGKSSRPCRVLPPQTGSLSGHAFGTSPRGRGGLLFGALCDTHPLWTRPRHPLATAQRILFSQEKLPSTVWSFCATRAGLCINGPHTCTHTHTHTHTHTRTRSSVCIYVSIYICIYLHFYIPLGWSKCTDYCTWHRFVQDLSHAHCSPTISLRCTPQQIQRAGLGSRSGSGSGL